MSGGVLRIQGRIGFGASALLAGVLLLAACARPEAPDTVQSRSLHAGAGSASVAPTPVPAPLPDRAVEALKAASGPVLPWTVKAGATLRAELDLWAGQAGWQLVWLSAHPYPIRAGARFTGTFPQAAYALIGAFRNADPAPVVTFYPANKVITVHSLSTGEDEED